MQVKEVPQLIAPPSEAAQSAAHPDSTSELISLGYLIMWYIRFVVKCQYLFENLLSFHP